jgi:hypothetical protein
MLTSRQPGSREEGTEVSQPLQGHTPQQPNCLQEAPPPNTPQAGGHTFNQGPLGALIQTNHSGPASDSTCPTNSLTVNAASL